VDGSYVFRQGKIYKVGFPISFPPSLPPSLNSFNFSISTFCPPSHTHPSFPPSLLFAQVPATLDEALMTSLIGLFEKRRFRNFLSYLAKYDEKDPNTFGGRKGGREGRGGIPGCISSCTF